nr:ribonuclease H-like domain-containing protein [Tanacetum cinerariifolium]
MIGNKCYLTEYDGGFISFGDGKGRISGKGKIKTGTLDFDDVYFWIKWEFSVPMTPQQNEVAEKKHKTLIEAARTMLVDSKLPTTFWAEAVNTACYVLNRALVIKPHNKKPYELIRRRPPLIDFMKPFGCPVTILNSRDYLGKFDEKADETKTVPASKGSRLKSSVKVAKTTKKKQPATMPKTKRLVILSEVALSEAEQIKLATKRSKTYFHMSQVSGLGDGVDIQSKVPDEQQQKVTGINEGADVRPEVPNVPKYASKSDEESWTFSQYEDDADEETYVHDDSEETKFDNDEDDLTRPNLSTYKADDKEEKKRKQMIRKNHQLIDKEENQEGNDEVKEGKEEQVEEELYRDLNINLQISDAEMTDAQQENVQANQVTKDTHLIITIVPPAVQQQNSSVSSNLVSKFINPYLDSGRSSSKKYTTSITKMKAADYGQVREGYFKQLQRQDIEDMLLLLIQDKLSNLNLEERHQKKINLTRPDTYRLDLKRMTPFTAYPDIQGIIYKDEMNKNRLRRTDELYKFSYGTLNHLRTVLNNIATGIEMDYLPQRK